MTIQNDKRTIIEILNTYITFIASAIPVRSIPTFIELLIGAMLNSNGFICSAYFTVNGAKHWGSYYKWIEKGKWSWLALAKQTVKLTLAQFPQKYRFWTIDDTLVLRLSEKAPSSTIHYDHSNKGNRPKYVRGQCWVVLGCVLGDLSKLVGVPIIARLTRIKGNTNKLITACVLLKSIRSFFNGKDIFLVDSWYMKGRVLNYAINMGLTTIGNIRFDTALYFKPKIIKEKRRGRPRKYGTKITTKERDKLQKFSFTKKLYGGKDTTVRYSETNAVARFLKGFLVKAVWCEFKQPDGSFSAARLLLSTDSSISGIDIILAYTRRYYTEPVFDDTKNRWGFKNTWQQSRQALHRWVHIIFVAYSIPKLIVLKALQLKLNLNIIPWRQKQNLTAGIVRVYLQSIFSGFRVRDAWNSKSRKFIIPIFATNKKKIREVDKVA